MMKAMSRVKTTLSIESELLRAVEAEASRTGKRRSELVEEALDLDALRERFR